MANLGAPVILMVSGGCDSCALFYKALFGQLDILDGRGLAQIDPGRLHVLHVNHMLRGEDAHKDQAFVEALAARYGIPCRAVRVPVAELAGEFQGNVELAGREVRYAQALAWAQELCDEQGLPLEDARILTAHSASDQAETYLMNLVRGSGLAGLASIPERRGIIVRPLLGYTHDQLEGYVRSQGGSWQEDATNKDTRYLRSFIRYKVIPLLKERNLQVVKTIASTCDLLQDDQDFLEEATSQALDQVRVCDADPYGDSHTVKLDVKGLISLHPALQRRVVKQVLDQLAPEARTERQHVERTLELAHAGTGSASLCEGIQVRVVFGCLNFTKDHCRQEAAGKPEVQVDAARTMQVSGRQEPVAFTPGWLEVPGTFAIDDHHAIEASLCQLEPGQPADLAARKLGKASKGAAVLVDLGSRGAERLRDKQLKLWVDTVHAGDRMEPLGMGGRTKKICDLLAEAHVGREDKAKVPIIRDDKDGVCVWVAQIRTDERFRCTQNPECLIELRFSIH